MKNKEKVHTIFKELCETTTQHEGLRKAFEILRKTVRTEEKGFGSYVIELKIIRQIGQGCKNNPPILTDYFNTPQSRFMGYAIGVNYAQKQIGPELVEKITTLTEDNKIQYNNPEKEG